MYILPLFGSKVYPVTGILKKMFGLLIQTAMLWRRKKPNIFTSFSIFAFIFGEKGPMTIQGVKERSHTVIL